MKKFLNCEKCSKNESQKFGPNNSAALFIFRGIADTIVTSFGYEF